MKDRFTKTNACWLLTIILSFVLLTLLMKVGIINPVHETMLATIIINIILAISLNLIIGITGQFSLGHAGFMCIGAYSAGVMMKQIPGMEGFLIGILIGCIVSALVAIVVAIPTLRLKGDYLAIATLGFGEIIRIVVLNMECTNGAAGLVLQKVVTFPLLFGALILSTLIVVNFGCSAPGRACISVREDEIASEAMGINTTKYKVMAFVIGAIVASLAGALYAGNFYVIKPEMFTFNKSIDILVIVVFGGMGSVTGSYIAAIVIGILNAFLQQFASIRMIIYGLALVAIMIFRPSGLLGTREFTFTKFFELLFKTKGGSKMTMLRVSELTKNFGGLCAVSHVSLEINDNELIGLIGPNGAGKTTLFNLLTGVYEPSEGKIELNINGEMKSIGGLKPYVVTGMGLARTFQNIRLFKNLSVIDNVKIAMQKDIRYGSMSAILRLPSYYREENRIHEEAIRLLEIVKLADKKDELAKNLPYGEQRRLEIARALATHPKILFLDEPAAGMNPQETAELTELIHQIKENFGLTIILIEHDMSLVMTICERIYVLDYGKLLAQGTPDEIKNNPKVIEAYLGEEI